MSDDNTYIVDDKLKSIIDSIINDVDDLLIDNKIKIVKTILACKFKLSQNDKKINVMMNSLFGESFKTLINDKSKMSQKKYYENNKQKYKDRYKERAEEIKERERMRYQEKKQKLKEYDTIIHSINNVDE